ncbi:hypothetical protein [Bacillus sp. CDB3]|uniref:hypothetical protein n=1 Tax=Bacillus sp. CDB3 TaxID=360310 RepID=UPI0009D7E490|nr:hypothetical protein [Bacillus sp. CDB3]OQR57629.1 hypothetical protein CDB3_06160 [Bacillus sp. CDB3]
MIKSMKDFTIGVSASLFATFLTTYFTSPIDLKSITDLKELKALIVNYKFPIYWSVFFILFSLLRIYVRRRIDKLQTPLPMVAFIGNSHDMKFKADYQGFKWEAFVDIKQRDRITKEAIDIHVSKVDGPYCKNDYRKMNESRAFFGRYKYKCPKCGYKQIHLKSKWTLRSELEDELEADYRNKQDVVS